MLKINRNFKGVEIDESGAKVEIDENKKDATVAISSERANVDIKSNNGSIVLGGSNNEVKFDINKSSGKVSTFGENCKINGDVNKLNQGNAHQQQMDGRFKLTNQIQMMTTQTFQFRQIKFIG